MPLRAEGRTLGVVVVQTYTPDRRLTDTDLEILTVVAGHIAVALERTRLLSETRQGSAELGLVNNVQRGLADRLELQAMYDLVGDRIQEIFDAQVVDIGILDPASGLLRFPYTIERGVRFPDEPLEVMGFRRVALETREPSWSTSTSKPRRRGSVSRTCSPASRRSRASSCPWSSATARSV